MQVRSEFAEARRKRGVYKQEKARAVLSPRDAFSPRARPAGPFAALTHRPVDDEAGSSSDGGAAARGDHPSSSLSAVTETPSTKSPGLEPKKDGKTKRNRRRGVASMASSASTAGGDQLAQSIDGMSPAKGTDDLSPVWVFFVGACALWYRSPRAEGALVVLRVSQLFASDGESGFLAGRVARMAVVVYALAKCDPFVVVVASTTLGLKTAGTNFFLQAWQLFASFVGTYSNHPPHDSLLARVQSCERALAALVKASTEETLVEFNVDFYASKLSAFQSARPKTKNQKNIAREVQDIVTAGDAVPALLKVMAEKFDHTIEEAARDTLQLVTNPRHPLPSRQNIVALGIRVGMVALLAAKAIRSRSGEDAAFRESIEGHIEELKEQWGEHVLGN